MKANSVFPNIIDNKTIYGNIFHRILAINGKFSAYYQCYDQKKDIKNENESNLNGIWTLQKTLISKRMNIHIIMNS